MASGPRRACRPTGGSSRSATPSTPTSSAPRSACSIRGPARRWARWTTRSRGCCRWRGRRCPASAGCCSSTSGAAGNDQGCSTSRPAERDDLDPGLIGAVFPEGWLPGGRAMLRHGSEGRDRLFSFEPTSATLEPLFDEGGSIDVAGVRPDGDAWIGPHSSVRPQRWTNLRGDTASHSPRSSRRADRIGSSSSTTRRATGSRPSSPRRRETRRSRRSSRYTAARTGITREGFDEGTQAYVDHGYAVLLVNYRGSTGYGVAFRDALRGNIGFPETEDVNLALDRVIADGVADPGSRVPRRLVVGRLPRHAERGPASRSLARRGAGIPVGDYVAAHYECAPPLRAWDLAVMGGSPMDLPELYRERNPMTYVDAVRAPMLILAGEHDSRCPLGQIMTYAHALKAHGERSRSISTRVATIRTTSRSRSATSSA